jgi:hypothetical protein
MAYGAQGFDIHPSGNGGIIRRAEADCILAALRECDGNRKRAARRLGISTTRCGANSNKWEKTARPHIVPPPILLIPRTPKTPLKDRFHAPQTASFYDEVPEKSSYGPQQAADGLLASDGRARDRRARFERPAQSGLSFFESVDIKIYLWYNCPIEKEERPNYAGMQKL